MTGKRYSATLFGGYPVILGQPVFVTADGGVIAGHVHHILDTVGPESRERVFVAYVTLGGWDEEPRQRVEELPFYDPKTREEADGMPPGHWCFPRTWQECEAAGRMTTEPIAAASGNAQGGGL